MRCRNTRSTRSEHLCAFCDKRCGLAATIVTCSRKLSADDTRKERSATTIGRGWVNQNCALDMIFFHTLPYQYLALVMFHFLDPVIGQNQVIRVELVRFQRVVFAQPRSMLDLASQLPGVHLYWTVANVVCASV